MMSISVITRFTLYVVIVFSVERSSEDIDYEELVSAVESYGQLDCLHSSITFVTDQFGNKFVIKQIKPLNDSGLYDLARSVCEIVALDIGHSVQVPVNYAAIIPAGVSFIGKNVGYPATIHAHAPGIRFDKYQGERYKGLHLRQKNSKNEITGLTREIIYHMSKHKDLAMLVALDTFVGNADRGRSNYFYDQTTDSFIGIDMAETFCRDICELAKENVYRLFKDE